jgi:hypothetical protein
MPDTDAKFTRAALQFHEPERLAVTYAVLELPLTKCKTSSTMPTMSKRWIKAALT